MAVRRCTLKIFASVSWTHPVRRGVRNSLHYWGCISKLRRLFVFEGIIVSTGTAERAFHVDMPTPATPLQLQVTRYNCTFTVAAKEN
jgi:hypothetical protein